MYQKALTVRKIRKLMEAGKKYSAACECVVKSLYTIEIWRNKYPRLDRYFLSLMDTREERIVDTVEEKLETRILNDKASPAEIIFYLCSRRPKRWKRQDGEYPVDQSMHYHYTKIGDDKIIDEATKRGISFPDEITRRITEASPAKPA